MRRNKTFNISVSFYEKTHNVFIEMSYNMLWVLGR